MMRKPLRPPPATRSFDGHGIASTTSRSTRTGTPSGTRLVESFLKLDGMRGAAVVRMGVNLDFTSARKAGRARVPKDRRRGDPEVDVPVLQGGFLVPPTPRGPDGEPQRASPRASPGSCPPR